MRKLILIFVLILLSSCRTTMEAKHFKEMKASENIVAFKLNFTYNNEKLSNNSVSCFVVFSDAKNTTFKSLNYNMKDDYIFVKGDAKEIYMNRVHCSNYRIFYNKVRQYKVDKKLIDVKDGKINYGGDIEINWIPKSFILLDLLLVGSGDFVQDEGTFSMKVTDNYSEFQNFLKKNYDNQIGSTVNSVDKQLITKFK